MWHSNKYITQKTKNKNNNVVCLWICIIAGYMKKEREREPAGINEAYRDKKKYTHRQTMIFDWRTITHQTHSCRAEKMGRGFVASQLSAVENIEKRIHLIIHSIYIFFRPIKAPPSLVLCSCLWQMSVTWQLDTLFLKGFFFF